MPTSPTAATRLRLIVLALNFAGTDRVRRNHRAGGPDDRSRSRRAGSGLVRRGATGARRSLPPRSLSEPCRIAGPGIGHQRDDRLRRRRPRHVRGVATAEVHAGQITARKRRVRWPPGTARSKATGWGWWWTATAWRSRSESHGCPTASCWKRSPRAGLSWAVGRRGGRCELANTVTSGISLEALWGGTAPVARVSGTVCGRRINREFHLFTGPAPIRASPSTHPHH